MIKTGSGSAAAEWRSYWPLVSAATMGMVLASALTSTLGVMMPALEAEFGWTRAEISSGPMVMSMIGIVLATAAGYAIDRIGARKVGIAVVIIMASSIALMATATSELWYWWLLWSLFGIAGSATSTVWLAPVSSLFVKGRGVAIAVVLTGGGIASGAVPLFLYFFIENFTWRLGYLALGLVLVVSTLPMVLRFWRGAEEFLVTDSAKGQMASDPATLPGMTVHEGFTSFDFYKIFFGYVVSAIASIALGMNLVPVLVYTGITPGQAAAIAGLHGVTGIVGRFAGGWVMDRYGGKWPLVFATAGSVALPIGLLLNPSSTAVAMAGVTISGLLSGVKFAGVAYVVSRYFGPRSFGTLYGTTSIAAAIAVGIGPMLANYVYDVTQSYMLVLWAEIPALLLAAACYATLGRPRDFETRC